MRTIAALNMLLRERVDLPASLKLSMDEFREGWSFIKRSDARRLEKKILKSGWNFFRMADGSLRSGVGDTSQLAISNALQLALRCVNAHFNAVEVEHIEVTCYPWFFLARVRVYPCRIQEEPLFSVANEDGAGTIAARPAGARVLPDGSAALYPDFGSAMPLLKQMLTASRAVELVAR